MPRRGVRPRVEHLRDVLRLDVARRACLALEARHDVGALLQRLADDLLHRNAPAGAGVPRLVDGPHAALAEQTNDAVLAVDDARIPHGGHDSRHHTP